MSYTTITANEFANRHRNSDISLCIDVRTSGEYKGAFCLGSHNLPLQDFNLQSVNEWLKAQAVDSSVPVYLMCLAGKRSVMAAEKLAGALEHPVVVVEGGVSDLPFDVMQITDQGVIPLERQVRIAAGSIVLCGLLLGTFVAPSGYWLSAFAGCGLVYAGLTDNCMMAHLLSRMPWNRA